MGKEDLLLFFMVNIFRTYIIKKYIELFLDENENTIGFQKWLYVFFFLFTSTGYLLFQKPIINLLTNTLGLILIVLIYRGNVKKKIMVVFLVYGINMFCDVIAVLSFPDYLLGNYENQIPGMITVLLIFVCYIIIRKFALRKINPFFIFPQWKYLIIMPISGIVLVHYLLNNNNTIYETIVIESLVFLIINIISFYLFVSMEKTAIDNIGKKEMEYQVKVYAQQLDTIINTQEKIRGLQHDMKAHLGVLYSMAKNNASNEMLEYLSEMQKYTSNPTEYVYSGNKEIDSIMNHLIEKAKKLLKEVEVTIKIPEKIQINPFDVNVILSNLFNNAIEGALTSKEKKLWANLEVQSGLFFISISNSYDGITNSSANGFMTRKDNKQEHGYGLKNIKCILQKYNGILELDSTNNIFKIEIMMYLSN